MDLGDICDADFEERQVHFRDQVCNYASSLEDQVWADKHGHDMATAEMLNEIQIIFPDGKAIKTNDVWGFGL